MYCDDCQFLKNNTCKIRNERISWPAFTYCQNNKTGESRPKGVMYVVSYELKGKSYNLKYIPYFNGKRAETFQRIPSETSVILEIPGAEKIFFNKADDYYSFYLKELHKKKRMILGAVVGDIIGSVYEFNNIKTTDFHLFSEESDFTDDSVLTVASMDALLNKTEYSRVYHQYGRKYPGKGYGTNFNLWIQSDYPRPYKSFGNGSAMRVSPIGWAYDNLEEVLCQAKKSAEITHNHPEGIKGAQAVAAAVFLARKGQSKPEIKDYISDNFKYDLNRTIDEIRPVYQFNESCQETVPEAIIAFLESDDFTSAIRLAVSIGGDSDTLACITGSIAEAFYDEIPLYLIENSLKHLPWEFIKIITEFSEKYRVAPDN